MFSPRINTFSHHYRKKYGCKVGKIPLDLGVVCPNRMRGGCIYCSSPAFSPGYLDRNDDIETQLNRGKSVFSSGRFEKYFGYFQQETSTSVEPEIFLKQVSLILEDELCAGVIISTRPDSVSDHLLQQLAPLIAKFHKECLFELGLQSSLEKSLKLLNRNHNVVHFTETVNKIRQYPVFEIGAHLIFGIPGESETDMFNSVEFVCSQGVDAVKFHHLQVLKDTPLFEMYIDGLVQPFSLEAYMDFLLLLLPRIPSHVVIHRLWATSHPALLVAPKWNVLATELSRKLIAKMKESNSWQGQKCRL